MSPIIIPNLSYMNDFLERSTCNLSKDALGNVNVNNYKQC